MKAPTVTIQTEHGELIASYSGSRWPQIGEHIRLKSVDRPTNYVAIWYYIVEKVEFRFEDEPTILDSVEVRVRQL